MINDHPWLKENASKEDKDKGRLVGIKLLERQAEDVYQFGTHLKAIFSSTIQDFSVVKEESVNAMKEMTEHFKNCHKEGKHYEM